jgi:hypothetical protein
LGRFPANAAWPVIATLAHNFTQAPGRLPAPHDVAATAASRHQQMSWDDAVWVVEPVDVAALLPVPGRWQRWNRAGTAVMLTELSHPTYRWKAAPPPPMTADERKAGAASLRLHATIGQPR